MWEFGRSRWDLYQWQVSGIQVLPVLHRRNIHRSFCCRTTSKYWLRMYNVFRFFKFIVLLEINFVNYVNNLLNIQRYIKYLFIYKDGEKRTFLICKYTVYVELCMKYSCNLNADIILALRWYIFLPLLKLAGIRILMFENNRRLIASSSANH